MLNLVFFSYYGVSRSATIVIAYIMKKHKLKFDKAFERVKLKRNLVSPNYGFIQQLRLFHRMGFRIDNQDEKYKIYRLRLAADKIQKAKILPSNFSDLIKPDPAITQEIPEPIVFRCKRCRRILANKSNLLLHYVSKDEISNTEENTPNQQMDQNIQKLLATSINENSQSEKSQQEKEAATICTDAYFFEPIAWMHDIINQSQGTLNCPKCKAKLGKFNWVMSSKCPCGKQVSTIF